MLTDSALEVASLRIASFYQTNQSAINSSMLIVATGNRVNSPADDSVDFFRISGMQSDVNGLSQIQRSLVDGTSMLNVAKAAGGSVFDDVSTLKDLVKSYYNSGATDADRSKDVTQFQSIKNRIANTISTTGYDGRQLISDNSGSPFWSSIIDPRDSSQRTDVSYNANDIVDVSSLTLGVSNQATESAAIDAQYGRASSYVGKTSAYLDFLNDQYSAVSDKMATYSQTIDNEQGADEGAAMTTLNAQDICSQSALSMLAQANTDRSSILDLLKNL